MKKFFLKLLLTAVVLSQTSLVTHAKERRCGWFQNPTPQNASLFDKEGEWIIGSQGGFQAEGDWPQFSAKQWVTKQASYGYGCACMDVETQIKDDERYITKIYSATAKALSECLKDKALRDPAT